jgi:hypothetical protein
MTVTTCLQSTRTLSVTVAGLRLNLFFVCLSRPMSGRVVVRSSGHAWDHDRLLAKDVRVRRSAAALLADRVLAGMPSIRRPPARLPRYLLPPHVLL